MNLRLQLYLFLLDIRTGWVSLIAKLRDMTRTRHSPPTPTCRRISASWLSKVMKEQVKQVTKSDVGENTGIVGSLTRFHVTTQADDDDGSKTISLILKTYGNRQSMLHTNAREHFFYTSSYAKSLAVPKVYYSHAGLGEMVVLMQDLTTEGNGGGGGGGGGGGVPVNQIMANQPWIKLPDGRRRLEPIDKLDMLRAIFLYAADMHAKHWNDRHLLQQPSPSPSSSWMRSALWFDGKGRHHWELGMETAKRGWEMLKRRNDEGDVKIPDSLCQCIDKSFQVSSWKYVRDHLSESPFTLCHGDYHAGNMILCPKKDDSGNIITTVQGLWDGLILVDWSEVGPWEPTTDLAQTVVSDLPRHLYAQVPNVLKHFYWDHLQRCGVAEYSWEECQRRFGQSGMERWIWVLGALSSYSLPSSFVDYFVTQMESFRTSFCPTDEYFYLKTCAYTLPIRRS